MQTQASNSYLATAANYVATILGTGFITIIVKDWLDRRRAGHAEQAKRGINEARARSVDTKAVRDASTTILELLSVISDLNRDLAKGRIRADRAELRTEHAKDEQKRALLEMQRWQGDATAANMQMQMMCAAASIKGVHLQDFTPKQLKDEAKRLGLLKE